MELKIFGKKLFEVKIGNGDAWTNPPSVALAKAVRLPDFKLLGSNSGWGSSDVVQWIDTSMNITSGTSSLTNEIVKVNPLPVKTKKTLTPKKVYDLRMLHNEAFRINMEPKYVDQQIADFKEKLGLMNDPGYNHKGFDEIGSILIRMENRKKYGTQRGVFEEFPYTTEDRISSVLKKHDYLKIGNVDQFVVELPKDAVATMKKYNDATQKLCDKKAVFYIIADKNDFQKTESRRDPILLAQSPFGHFWQILGAWDKEMLFLNEL